jgi:hypothetical protein
LAPSRSGSRPRRSSTRSRRTWPRRWDDPELRDIILSIREEELAHLHHTEERIEAKGPWPDALHRLITVVTDAVIWLSTWGDSSRMARDLRAAAAR